MSVDVRINITFGDLLRFLILRMVQIILLLILSLDRFIIGSVTIEKSIYLAIMIFNPISIEISEDKLYLS